MKRVSVIIPARNEEAFIAACLKSVLMQPADYLAEVIVADSGTDDATRAVCEQHGVMIVQGGYPAEARNNGARCAAGEFLLFLDADTRLPDDFFARAMPEFEQTGARCGIVLFVPAAGSIKIARDAGSL